MKKAFKNLLKIEEKNLQKNKSTNLCKEKINCTRKINVKFCQKLYEVYVK